MLTVDCARHRWNDANFSFWGEDAAAPAGEKQLPSLQDTSSHCSPAGPTCLKPSWPLQVLAMESHIGWMLKWLPINAYNECKLLLVDMYRRLWLVFLNHRVVTLLWRNIIFLMRYCGLTELAQGPRGNRKY